MQLSGVCAAATVSAQPADRQGEKKKKLFFQSDSGPAEETELGNVKKKHTFHYASPCGCALFGEILVIC